MRVDIGIDAITIQCEFPAGVTDDMTAFLARLIVKVVGGVALFLFLFRSVISEQAIIQGKFSSSDHDIRMRHSARLIISAEGYQRTWGIGLG